MTVVFLTSNLNIGGAQKNLVYMANSLAVNHEVTVVSFSNKLDHYQLSEKIKIIGCNRDILKLIYVIAFNKSIRYASHVMVFNYSLLFLSVLFSKNTKLIFRFINNYALQERNVIRTIIYDILLNVTKKRIFCYVAQCQSMMTEMTKKLGAEAKISVLYNPIIYKGVTSQKKIYDFIFIGKLTLQKDPLRALSELYEYKKKYGTFNAIFIGDGYLREQFISEIKKLRLENEVKWIAVSDQVDDLLLQSKVCICTSRYEGFPNVLLEALSHCVPVVSFTFEHGLNEIISCSDIGKIIKRDPDNINNEFVEALHEYLLLAVNDDAFERALANFTIDEYNKKLKSILL